MIRGITVHDVRPGLRLFDDRHHHVLHERFADRSWLLGPVEDRDVQDGCGQRRDQRVRGERPEEAHLDEADLLSLVDECVDGFLGRPHAGAHHDDDVGCVGCSDVVEEVVAASRPVGELVHSVLDDVGNRVVEGVAGFSGLEEHVGVLGCAAQHRTIRIHPTIAVGEHTLDRNERSKVVVGQLLDHVHLV